MLWKEMTESFFIRLQNISPDEIFPNSEIEPVGYVKSGRLASDSGQ